VAQTGTAESGLDDSVQNRTTAAAQARPGQAHTCGPAKL